MTLSADQLHAARWANALLTAIAHDADDDATMAALLTDADGSTVAHACVYLAHVAVTFARVNGTDVERWLRAMGEQIEAAAP